MLNKFIKFILYKIMINLVKIKTSLMAHWIARMTSDHKVGGSSPSGVEFFLINNNKDFFVNITSAFKSVNIYIFYF